MLPWAFSWPHMLDVSFGFPVSTSGLNATEPLRDGLATCRGVEAGDCGVLAPLMDRLEPKGTCWVEAGWPAWPVAGLDRSPVTEGDDRCVRFPADFLAC